MGIWNEPDAELVKLPSIESKVFKMRRSRRAAIMVGVETGHGGGKYNDHLSLLDGMRGSCTWIVSQEKVAIEMVAGTVPVLSKIRRSICHLALASGGLDFWQSTMSIWGCQNRQYVFFFSVICTINFLSVQCLQFCCTVHCEDSELEGSDGANCIACTTV